MRWRRRQVTEETAVPPRRRPPLIWPWLALLLLVVAALIAAAILLTRDDDTPHVPNVVGQSTAQAVGELGDHGYSADVQTTIRPSAQPGKVVSQAPEAGTKLDKGSRVTIVSARGKVTVGVPAVVGLSVPNAFARLQAAGLKGKTRAVGSGRTKDTVLAQSPAAEGRADKGSFVVLTISKGSPNTVTVPRVVGLTEAQATAKLDPLGFGTRVTRIPSTKTAGLVISQVPVQGTKAKRGSVVGLNVSDGPPTTTNTTTTTSTTTTTTTTTTPPNPSGSKVPKVVGMGQAQAMARLQAAGFRVDSYPVASSSSPRARHHPAPSGRSARPGEVAHPHQRVARARREAASSRPGRGRQDRGAGEAGARTCRLHGADGLAGHRDLGSSRRRDGGRRPEAGSRRPEARRRAGADLPR